MNTARDFNPRCTTSQLGTVLKLAHLIGPESSFDSVARSVLGVSLAEISAALK